MVLSLAFIIFSRPFLDFIMRFQSVFPTYLFIFSLGFICFSHLLAHSLDFIYFLHWFLPFIRGFHHVPFLLQCVYYALSLSNFSIISIIYRQVLVLRICRNSRPRPLWDLRVHRIWFIFRVSILQQFSSTKNPALPPWFFPLLPQN